MTLAEGERHFLRQCKESHDKDWQRERQKYYSRKLKSKKRPDAFLSVMVDGMESGDAILPHYVPHIKNVSNHALAEMRIVGLQDSLGNNLCFVHTEDLAKDSNMTITVLMEYLKRLDKLPPTLYLQLDNCSRENKNQFVFGFVGWLVQHDTFQEVKIGFLIVGHTHEHIDQFFSVLQKLLSHYGARTVLHLLQQLVSAHKNVTVTAEMLQDVVQFREFIAKYLVGMHSHTKPHHFHFKKINGKVHMRSRFLSNSQWTEWFPIFESDPALVTDFKVAPRKEFDWDAKALLVPKHQSILTEEEVQTWYSFIEEQGARAAAVEDSNSSATLTYILPKCVPQRPLPVLVPAPAGTRRSVLQAGGSTLEHLRNVFPVMDPEHLPAVVPDMSGPGPSGTVYHGKYRRLQTSSADVEFNECTIGTMICYLASYLSADDDTCPFWMGKVSGVLKEAKQVQVEWYARSKKSQPWETSTWHEWYNILTQEMYDDLPEKQKTKHLFKKIGKPHKKSVEVMDLDPSLVLYCGFSLTKSNKISAADAKKLAALLKEQV